MFDPIDFFHLACKLHNNIESSDQCEARSSVNRAYYACHLVAREKAKINDENVGVHKEVITYYQKRDKTLANRLKDLFERRKKADYNIVANVTQRDSGRAISIATEILRSLGNDPYPPSQDISSPIDGGVEGINGDTDLLP